VTATLLDILTPELVSGMAEFLRSCQTYEGGFASSSHPYYSAEDGEPQVLSGVRPILGEAHGGYTSCAIASWMMLQPYQKAGGKLYIAMYAHVRDTNGYFRSQRKCQEAG
jgi:protein farnesyltransferase subunit beta